MARSTYGSRRALPWAVAQKPKPMPRVVRLGRAANDNARLSGMRAKLAVIGLAAAALALVLVQWLA
ncbi:MAG: hypothetical protein E6G95_18250 [Alphaproteobacteria bacterium]|nr:MAG: hypothetical protein E6G95_18250 [Alphaproteobacteria bacterium]